MIFEYTDMVPHNAIRIMVDASLLKKSFCESAFLYTLDGLRATKRDPILVTGTAVHLFAALSHTESPIVALAKGTELYATVEKDTSKFVAIAASMPPKLLPPPVRFADRIGIEFYFEVPWLTFVHDDLVYCIIICGTMDHLSFHNDVVKIFDYKTTRKYKLEDARAGYKNDVQFMFYPWVIWKFGHHFLPLEMHNAARDFRLTTQVVLVQLTIKPPKWFVDSPIGVSQDKFEHFEEEIRATLKDMMTRLLNPAPPRMNGWVSNNCPRCDFNDLCHALPGTEDAVRARMYHKKEYKPSAHGTENLAP